MKIKTVKIFGWHDLTIQVRTNPDYEFDHAELDAIEIFELLVANVPGRVHRLVNELQEMYEAEPGKTQKVITKFKKKYHL